MKKFFIILSLFFSLNLISDTNTSSGYDNLKSIVSGMNDVQKSMNLHTLIINAILDQLNSICGEQVSCDIDKPITYTVTQKMQELDSSHSLITGNIVTIPSNTLSFKKLDDEKFDYSIKMDVSKIVQNQTGIETFRWNDIGDIKSITLEQGNMINYFTELISPNGNTLIANGSISDKLDPFDTSSPESNMSYKIKMTQYATNNGVELTSTFKLDIPSFTIPAPINQTIPAMHIKEESIAKADDNGGYIESYISSDTLATLKIKEFFDGNGTIISSATGSESIDCGDYNITKDELPSTNIGISNPSSTQETLFFVVVKEGKSPTNPENILGYGSYYKNDNDNNIDLDELNFDYFGSKELLATSNSTTDEDKLDIFIDNKDGTFSSFTGIWLKK